MLSVLATVNSEIFQPHLLSLPSSNLIISKREERKRKRQKVINSLKCSANEFSKSIINFLFNISALILLCIRGLGARAASLHSRRALHRDSSTLLQPECLVRDISLLHQQCTFSQQDFKYAWILKFMVGRAGMKDGSNCNKRGQMPYFLYLLMSAS